MSRGRHAYVLASGGIDSTACMAYYFQQGFVVRPIFIDFGHPANSVERHHIGQIASHYGVALREIVLRGVGVNHVGEVTGRNAAFVAVALMSHPGMAGILSMGIHRGSPYYDCTPRFRDHMSTLLSESTNGQVQFDAPFIEVEKPGIVEYGREHALPFNLTYSCESGAMPPCGDCPSCKDRKALDI